MPYAPWLRQRRIRPHELKPGEMVRSESRAARADRIGETPAPLVWLSSYRGSSKCMLGNAQTLPEPS